MLNKAILMGRLTKDPELRTTASAIPVTSFTLAVDRDYGKGEERQTDFIDIVCWRHTAEFTSKWFHKGQLVAVSGRIQQRKWQDRDGNNRYSFEVVADEAHFAERKSDSPGYSAPPPIQASAPPPARGSAPTPIPSFDIGSGYSDMSDDDDDGELPF